AECDRGRPVEYGDRPAAVPQRGHGQTARQRGTSKARAARPHPGGDPRLRDRPGPQRPPGVLRPARRDLARQRLCPAVAAPAPRSRPARTGPAPPPPPPRPPRAPGPPPLPTPP